MAVPQPVTTQLTRAAIFLVLTINPGPDAASAVRSFCAGFSGLVRAIGTRDSDAGVTCVMGVGSEAWDRLFGDPRPAELHPFRAFKAGSRQAVATPGDLLFHIRAQRMDLCFELALHIMTELGDAVVAVDETHGFRYFDDRDLIGFVDGAENPQGADRVEATIVGAEDAAFAGGSYVIVQKYLHDLAAWNGVPTETQERIVGRIKLADIELDDAAKPTWAHNALTVIEENGAQQQILRANMPFGRAGSGESGTYFIGYCRTPRVTEKMIENMFVGRPPGNYDRLLDFTRPVTETLFFTPSATFLDAVTDDEPASAPAAEAGPAEPPPRPTAGSDGSLGIGSLKREKRS